jgi:hypothetical protein
MKLLRDTYLVSGIFGLLLDENGKVLCQTLEHAYLDESNPILAYVPKLPAGAYTCVRGMHQLEGMVQPFETFQITDVPGHTNILFHSGNFNADSAGCVLLGLVRDGTSDILQSRVAFDEFMAHNEGIDSFVLTVV